MTQAEITSLVTTLGDIAAVLRNADPADKAEVYRRLGLRLTYQPETQTVRAEADLSAHRGVMVRVRGSTLTRCLPHRTNRRADSRQWLTSGVVGGDAATYAASAPCRY
jgi:hypothetical protein